MTTRFSILLAILLASTAFGADFNVFTQKKAVAPSGTTTKSGKEPAELANVQPQIHFDFDDPEKVSESGIAHIQYTVTGTASAPGHVGLAREFLGGDSKITIQTNLSEFITSEYTVAFWVQTHRGSGLLFESNDPSGVALRLVGDGVDMNTCKQLHIVNRSKVKPEEWTHIAATYDSSVARLYLNGKVVGEKDVANRLKFGANSSIGQNSRNHITDDSITEDKKGSFNGSIDDLRVYDVALSPDQIAALAR